MFLYRNTSSLSSLEPKEGIVCALTSLSAYPFSSVAARHFQIYWICKQYDSHNVYTINTRKIFVDIQRIPIQSYKNKQNSNGHGPKVST